MIRRMWVVPMLCVAMIMAVVAACQPAAAPAPVAPAAPKQPQAPAPAAQPQAVVAASPTPTAAKAPPQPQVSAIKRGGVLRMQDIGLLDLDPSQTTGPLHNVTGACYERLVGYRAASYGDLTLEPWLASSWEVSKDGKAWTFHLQKNVHWQNVPPVNGRLFTSADVAWTVDYVKAKTAHANLWKDVVRYETPDDFTIIFYLEKPLAPFMILVAAHYNKMYPHEVIERDGSLKTCMVCTGPFMLKSWVEDSMIVLVKSPNYWQVGEDGKPLPYLDGVTTFTVKDAQARLATLRSGQTELLYSTLSKAEALDIQKNHPEIDFMLQQSDNAHGLMMNVSVPPWDNLLLRKALSLAFDRNKFVQLLFDGDGEWNSYVEVAGWGWDDAETKKRFASNLEEAKRLVQQSGYKGEPILYTGYNGGAINNGTDGGAILFQMTEPAGFRWDPKWLPDAATNRKMFIAGNFGTSHFPYISGTTLDPDQYLYHFFHSSSPTSSNWGRVNDPVLDKLIDAQRGELDEAKRKQLVRDCIERIYQQMYYIPTASINGYSPRSGAIRDMPRHKSETLVHIARAWLDK